ncbi:MAG: flavin monoamine oxidase family protein [Hyalangium sp.]|uniref:flavin monoamine oxidase family protein n=1 Tax=Hyalangium sp. TaxID=2028555 RepID=UPI0038998B61
MSDELTQELDVAIVGAGISGVYAGWKLKQLHRNLKITVFEASDRVGGRLLSVVPPGIPNMVAELGGMRFLPAVQPRIKALIDTLNQNAKPEELIETYDFPVDQKQNIAYLRGTHLRLEDFEKRPRKVPYKLSFLESGRAPGAILVNAIEQIVPGITAPGLTEQQRRLMTQNAEFAGEKLYKQGFWQVLARVISGEAYQLAIDAGGYQSTLNNWNAADAIPWYLADFGVDPVYQGFRRGFQQVPLAVAERFKMLGGEIKTQTNVVSFEVETDKSVLLHAEHKPEHAKDKQQQTVRAKVLILAMPRRALDLLRARTSFLQQDPVTRLIHSVTPQPLFKLFTTYKDPWWLPAGVEAGRTTTDLPVRQTYYWPKNDGTSVTGGRAMLMASYDDGLNIGFWDGLRNKRSETTGVPPKDPFIGFKERMGEGGQVDKEWSDRAPPKAMVEEVQRQLMLIHGLGFIPNAVEASYMDWGADPHGGGWNSWNIGVNSFEVKRDIIQPVSEKPVYICGEAYSHAQGWVEGALETADLMLEKLEKLPLCTSAR